MVLELAASLTVVSLVEMQIHWPHLSLQNQNLRGEVQDPVN